MVLRNLSFDLRLKHIVVSWRCLYGSLRALVSCEAQFVLIFTIIIHLQLTRSSVNELLGRLVKCLVERLALPLQVLRIAQNTRCVKSLDLLNFIHVIPLLSCMFEHSFVFHLHDFSVVLLMPYLDFLLCEIVLELLNLHLYLL